MVRETSFGIRGGFDPSDYGPEPSIQDNKLLSPVGKAANQISQIITNAEERTVSALAATNPNDQLGRVLTQIARLIRGGNDGVPDIRGRELEIAQAVFDARKLILNVEKGVLGIAKFPVIEKPIRQIAEGRLQAISRQESLSPPLKSQDTLTPEDVVRIGQESLAKAGGKIQGALYLLQANAEPGEIPPILAAVINAISPQDTKLNETTIERFLDGKVNTNKLPILDEKNALQNLIFKKDKLNIPNQIDMRGLPGTGLSRTSVDSINGLPAESSNPTQDLLTLPEAVLLQIGYPLDRNSRTSGNVTPD